MDISFDDDLIAPILNAKDESMWKQIFIHPIHRGSRMIVQAAIERLDVEHQKSEVIGDKQLCAKIRRIQTDMRETIPTLNHE